MPAVSRRKVIRLGGSEGANVVSLPASYCRAMGIKPGDAVTVVYNRIAVIIPPSEQLTPEVLDHIKEELEAMQRALRRSHEQ